MTPFLFTINSIFAKYWKQIIIVVAILGLGFTIYYKGRSDCAYKAEQEINREVKKRLQEVQKVLDKTEKIDNNIQISRESKPIDDARDSCLLSNNPYRVKCVQ